MSRFLGVVAWFALVMGSVALAQASKQRAYHEGFEVGVSTVLCAEASAKGWEEASSCASLSNRQRAYALTIGKDVQTHPSSDNMPSR